MVIAASGLMESRLAQGGFEHVAGVDEVGRGALAGPLVAAAVILPPGTHIEGLRDSKLCTRRQRSMLARQIHQLALAVAIVRVRPARIDRVGLHRCNLQALRKALRSLELEPDYILVDGFKLGRMSIPVLGVKKADAVSTNVAAASIVAKEHRDSLMRRYHRKYPHYGFSSNVGYATSYHRRALKRYGPSPIHRKSFAGVDGFPPDHAVAGME